MKMNINQSGLALIPFLIILALAAVGAYFYVSQKPFPYLVKNPSPTAGVDTANWQTYRNEQYGFEVKYPEDWEYEVSGGGELTMGPNRNYPAFQVFPYVSSGTSIDILKSFSGYEGKWGWQDTKVDNQPAFTKTVETNSKVINGLIVSGRINMSGYLVENKDTIYEIILKYEIDGNFQKDNALLNQILSSFKFTK